MTVELDYFGSVVVTLLLVSHCVPVAFALERGIFVSSQALVAPAARKYACVVIMASLNYHELTMNEPRDSPHRRQQFLVICTIMAGCFVYSTIMAGILKSVNITEGKFPGGDFVYKSAKRDYAAAQSLEEQVANDLGIKPRDKEDKIYTIFLDHPGTVASGREQRFASGFLSKNKSDRSLKDKLVAMNPTIQPPTKLEVMDLSVFALWPRLRYKEKSLPAAKAAVVYFPNTNGFVSSLMFTTRILPALRKYATEKQKAAGIKSPSVTIISTCSMKDEMCTHYAPLEKGDSFLLGQPRMEDYVKTLPAGKLFDVAELSRMVRRSSIARYFGISRSDEL